MNKTEVVTFDALPKTEAEVRAILPAFTASPFKMAALAVAVLMQYEENRDETVRMMNAIKGPQPLSNMDIQFLRDRLAGKMYVVRSYFKGTSPDNGYTVPDTLQIEVSDNPYSYQNEHYAVLYLHSSGADSPRPVTLRQKPSTGEWFLWQHTFLSDIRIPTTMDEWA